MIDPNEAARLIRAVARDNTFTRGRKNRMEAWKVMFGVYVSARYKYPTYTIAGVHWKMHFTVIHVRGRGYADASTMVRLPTPSMMTDKQNVMLRSYVAQRTGGKGLGKQDEDMRLDSYNITFDRFEGDEDAFKKDFTMLRMFDSEWEEVPGRSAEG